MATSKEVAERLLKLLTGHEVEDEALDDCSTYWLHEGLTELVERARIGVEIVAAWEQEKDGEASPASEPIWNPAPAVKPDDGLEYVGNLVGRTCGHRETCYVLPVDSDDLATKLAQGERLVGELAAACKLPCTACAAANVQPEKRIPRDYLGYQWHGQHIPPPTEEG